MPLKQEPIAEFTFDSGYISSAAHATDLHSAMHTGSRSVLVTGMNKPRTFKGVGIVTLTGGSRAMLPAGNDYAGLGRFADSSGKGGVVKVLSALFFAGTGRLFYNGAQVGSLNASSVLQLTLLTSGSYSTSAYQAGLSQPSAPTIATRTSLGVGMSGKLKAGTYSVRVTKVRSTTGVRSPASPASNVAISTESGGVGKSLRVTFPAIGSNGADYWQIYVSPKGFGSTGPHYLLAEIAETDLTTVDSVARSYEIEWSDGDLVGKPLAPIDNDPPPACVFVGALGDCTFVDGCYGDVSSGVTAAAPGSTIAVSLPLRPEEFPVDWVLFPPDAPTALLRGGDGFYYRFGKNSMGVISYTGGVDVTPLSYQLYWGNIGINYAHNACLGEGGRLYAKSGKKLVRIGPDGEPEMAWAAPILDDIASWADADTVLGWDQDSGHLCVMNGRTIYAYNPELDRWAAPMVLGTVVDFGGVPGSIVSAVTHDGHLYFSCLDATNSRLSIFQFNAGNGSTAEVYSDWHFADESVMIRQIDILGRYDNINTIEVKVFANEDDTTAIFEAGHNPTSAAGKAQRIPPFRVALPDLQSFKVYVKHTSSGGDAVPAEKITVKGTRRGIIR